MNIESHLKIFGLSKQEIRVYLGLIEIGNTTSGPLCKQTRVHSSHIYSILENLQEKGLVSIRLHNNRKVFAPSIQALKVLLDEKRKYLDLVQEELKAFGKMHENNVKSTYQEFKGQYGIKSMWQILNQQMSSGRKVKLYAGCKESYANFVGFYDEHHKIQEKKKVKEQIIFDVDDSEAERRTNKLTEVRLLELKNNAEWGIVNNMFFIQYIISKEPISILFQDTIFSQTFEQVFDQLWNCAKKRK